MTVSSGSLSSDEVEDVVAIAAGVGGLRAAAGGNAACWRAAGAITVLGAVDAGGFAAVAVLGTVFGTTLRAIGRGFGNGIFGLAAASLVHACDPMSSASVVAIAVERNAAARADWVTTFLCGESRRTNILRSN
jgi:hypothetical protein